MVSEGRRGRGSTIALVVLLAAALLYAVLTPLCLRGAVSASAKVLLAFRYVVLLPAVLSFLASSRSSAEPPGLRWAVARNGVIPLFLAAAASLSWATADGIVIPDESAYRFQARTILLGRSAAEGLPVADDRDAERSYRRSWLRGVPEEVDFEHHVLLRGQWFGKYPPGWPVVLAGGEALGLGWLVNPLLGVVLLGLTAAVARRLFGPPTAALAVLFAAASPYFLANCIGYMSHAWSGDRRTPFGMGLTSRGPPLESRCNSDSRSGPTSLDSHI